MKTLILSLILCTSWLVSFSQTKGLKGYYTKISQGDFLKYDSSKLIIKSSYGSVYHTFKQLAPNFEGNYLVLEKNLKGGKKQFFEMDALTKLANDSTFMLCEPPLKVTSDTSIWINGIWFYQNTIPPNNVLVVDSIPKNLLFIDYKSLKKGVYQYKNDNLIKILDEQTGKSFYKLEVKGFFYLPNPGVFYTLAGFDEIR